LKDREAETKEYASQVRSLSDENRQLERTVDQVNSSLKAMDEKSEYLQT